MSSDHSAESALGGTRTRAQFPSDTLLITRACSLSVRGSLPLNGRGTQLADRRDKNFCVLVFQAPHSKKTLQPLLGRHVLGCVHGGRGTLSHGRPAIPGHRASSLMTARGEDRDYIFIDAHFIDRDVTHGFSWRPNQNVSAEKRNFGQILKLPSNCTSN